MKKLFIVFALLGVSIAAYLIIKHQAIVKMQIITVLS